MAMEYLVVFRTPLDGYTIASSAVNSNVKKQFRAVKLDSRMAPPQLQEVADLQGESFKFIEAAAIDLGDTGSDNLFVNFVSDDVRVIIAVDSTTGVFAEVASVFVKPDDILDLPAILALL